MKRPEQALACLPGLTNNPTYFGGSAVADADSKSARPVVTRKQAKALGLVRYFTGKPCPHGHMAERFTSYGQCEACVVQSRDAWYHANKKRAAVKNARWMINNNERKRAINAKWRALHPEQAKAAVEAHYIANPEMYAVYRANRRARMRAAPGDGITSDDIKRLIFKQGGKCACCGLKKKLTLDHITPLARGGAHDVTNAEMLCKSCNSSKCAKDPIEFAQSLGRLL